MKQNIIKEIINKNLDPLSQKIDDIKDSINLVNTKIDKTLYHGMRTKKSPYQIQKEGFSVTYKTIADSKKEIREALRYFGKEKLLTSSGIIGKMIRQEMKMSKHRRNIWATTIEDSVCEWWAHANPEHISQALTFANIKPEDINKYLKSKYGSNCLKITLKITSINEDANFNTGLNQISPNLIEKVELCKDCNYTSKIHN